MQIYSHRSSRAVLGSSTVSLPILFLFFIHDFHRLFVDSLGSFHTSRFEDELFDPKSGPRVQQAL